jgi:hypothetical protein
MNIPLISDHFDVGFWRNHSQDLLCINLCSIIFEAAISKHNPERAAFAKLLDKRVVDFSIAIEACY